MNHSDPSLITRYEWKLPAWLKDGIFELAIRKKKNVNQLLIDDVLEKYPFYIHRVLNTKVMMKIDTIFSAIKKKQSIG